MKKSGHFKMDGEWPPSLSNSSIVNESDMATPVRNAE